MSFDEHIIRGLELLQQPRELSILEEAEEAFRNAIRVRPESSDAWLHLADTLRYKGLYQPSENKYLKSIELDGSNCAARTNLGLALQLQEKYSEAICAYIGATECAPTSYRAWNNLGLCLEHEKRLDEARDAYETSTTVYASYARAWENLARTENLLERVQPALDAYHRYIALVPRDYITLCITAGILFEQGYYSSAEKIYRKAIKVNSTDPRARFHLAYALRYQDKFNSAARAIQQVIRLNPERSLLRKAWRLIAAIREERGDEPQRILDAYRRMGRITESLRAEQSSWTARMQEFETPSLSFQRASDYAIGVGEPFVADSLRFVVQSKGRTLQELIDHDPTQVTQFLIGREKLVFERLDYRSRELESELSSIYRQEGVGGRTAESRYQLDKWSERNQKLDQDFAKFETRFIDDHPELRGFVSGIGPNAREFRFSLSRLRKKLGSKGAVLEYLYTYNGHLLVFLIKGSGIACSSVFQADHRIDRGSGPTLKEFRSEVLDTLHIGIGDEPHCSRCVSGGIRATGIGKDLTPEVLSRWGDLLYRPVIEELEGIDRLYVSPHSFLTQLPFGAVPFPDGKEREVVVIPSAANLTDPVPRRKFEGPSYTLGIVAADGEPGNPLHLQPEEVRRLRDMVPSAERMWELSGNEGRPGATLTNLQKQKGRTGCLVLSCHGDGPDDDWGTLALGTQEGPERVTGRELVDTLLLGRRSRQMEVDVLITSACLTGQVNMERSEEWLGLPMALQSIWKTRAMLLTLWEVVELPAMIWVTTLVEELTGGANVGKAHERARDRVRTTTVGDIQGMWLPAAQESLSAKAYDSLESWWNGLPRRLEDATSPPFSDPVYWAPFTLVGDPTVTIS